MSVLELLHTLGVLTTPMCRAEAEATLTLGALKHEVIVLLLLMLRSGRGGFRLLGHWRPRFQLLRSL